MARTKAVLGSGARLSDYLSASLLAREKDGVKSQCCSVSPSG